MRLRRQVITAAVFTSGAALLCAELAASRLLLERWRETRLRTGTYPDLRARIGYRVDLGIEIDDVSARFEIFGIFVDFDSAERVA